MRSPSTDLQERLQQDRSARSVSIYLLPYLEYSNLRSIIGGPRSRSDLVGYQILDFLEVILEVFFIWNERLTKKTATRLISSRVFDRVQKSPDLFVAGSAAPKIHGRSQDHAPIVSIRAMVMRKQFQA